MTLAKELCFKDISSDEVKKVIKNLNRKRSATSSCIPVSILIDSMDIYLPFLTDVITDSLKTGMFPDELQLAEEEPYSKKLVPLTKPTTDQLVYFLIFQMFLKE